MLKGWLCRSILFPKCAREGRFDPLALLLLNKVDNEGAVYALSLASKFVLRGEDGVHGYGIRTAARINEAYEMRNGGPPTDKKKTFYLGFYDALKHEYLSISSEHYNISLRYRLEHGERAHFQLELTNKGLLGTGKANDKTRRDDRIAAMEQLLTKLQGPIRCNSAQNDDLPQELKELELPRLARQVVAVA